MRIHVDPDALSHAGVAGDHLCAGVRLAAGSVDGSLGALIGALPGLALDSELERCRGRIGVATRAWAAGVDSLCAALVAAADAYAAADAAAATRASAAAAPAAAGPAAVGPAAAGPVVGDEADHDR